MRITAGYNVLTQRLLGDQTFRRTDVGDSDGAIGKIGEHQGRLGSSERDYGVRMDEVVPYSKVSSASASIPDGTSTASTHPVPC